MTNSTYYTDYYEAYNSSVIDQVWYDAQTKNMYVGLLNGTLCGYSDVAPEIFKAFTAQEDAGQSIGKYWNEFIKPGLTGKSTEDEGYFLQRGENGDNFRQAVNALNTALDDVESGGEIESDYDDYPTPKLDQLIAQAPVWANESPQYLDLPETGPVRNEYLIAFEHDEEHAGEIVLFASSIEEALANFDIVKGAARYVNVVIKSVTLFLN